MEPLADLARAVRPGAGTAVSNSFHHGRWAGAKKTLACEVIETAEHVRSSSFLLTRNKAGQDKTGLHSGLPLETDVTVCSRSFIPVLGEGNCVWGRAKFYLSRTFFSGGMRTLCVAENQVCGLAGAAPSRWPGPPACIGALLSVSRCQSRPVKTPPAIYFRR